MPKQKPMKGGQSAAYGTTPNKAKRQPARAGSEMPMKKKQMGAAHKKMGY